MTKNRTFASVGALALVGLLAGGCARQEHPVAADVDQPFFLDQRPAPDAPQSTQLTTAMWRFDAGIGDTAQGVGGGGNAQ